MLLNNNILLRHDDHVDVPNQVTSRATFLPFVNGANDWQGRPIPIRLPSGVSFITWMEGTNHSDYNSASHSYNIVFSNDDWATQGDPNEDLAGNPITGFPLTPPTGSTGYVDANLVECANGDLLLLAQNRGVNASAWNGVNFSIDQWRSTDGGLSWTFEFDWVNAVFGYSSAADKARVQGCYEFMLVGSTIYIICCEIITDLDNTRIVLVKSTDNGATYTIQGYPVETGEAVNACTESSLAHLGGGVFFFVFRTQDLGNAVSKFSFDSGLTYTSLVDFADNIGHVGVHQPRVKQYSNFFLLMGRDNKRVPTGLYTHSRAAYWTTTNLFSTPAIRRYLDPFYSGIGTTDITGGDAGYAKAIQKSDGSFLFFGYFGTNAAASIYKYDVSHTNTPSNEHYNNTEFVIDEADAGVRLQLNRDNITASASAPSVGIAIISRAHNTLATGDNTWITGGTVVPELLIQNNRGAAYFSNGRIQSNTNIPNLFFDVSFSVCFKIKPDDGNPAATQMILWNNSTTSTALTDGFQIQLTTDGKIFARYGEAGTIRTAITNTAIFANGATTETHIAVTLTDGDLIRIYVNGVLQTLDAVNNGSLSGITMASFSSANPVYLGQRNNLGTFDLSYTGTLREFILQTGVWDATAIANRALN